MSAIARSLFTTVSQGTVSFIGSAKGYACSFGGSCASGAAKVWNFSSSFFSSLAAGAKQHAPTLAGRAVEILRNLKGALTNNPRTLAVVAIVGLGILAAKKFSCGTQTSTPQRSFNPGKGRAPESTRESSTPPGRDVTIEGHETTTGE